MSNIFIELLREHRSRLLSRNNPLKELPPETRSSYGVAMFFYMVFMLGFFLYALDPDSLDILTATMMTFDGFIFFLTILVASFGIFFIIELVLRLFGVRFSNLQRLVAQTLTSSCVIVSMLLVFNMNFIHENIERNTIDFIEENFGAVTSVSFEKVGENTYSGKVRLHKPQEGNGLYYEVVVNPYQKHRKHDYTLDLQYDFVNLK